MAGSPFYDVSRLVPGLLVQEWESFCPCKPPGSSSSKWALPVPPLIPRPSGAFGAAHTPGLPDACESGKSFAIRWSKKLSATLQKDLWTRSIGVPTVWLELGASALHRYEDLHWPADFKITRLIFGGARYFGQTLAETFRSGDEESISSNSLDESLLRGLFRSHQPRPIYSVRHLVFFNCILPNSIWDLLFSILDTPGSLLESLSLIQSNIHLERLLAILQSSNSRLSELIIHMLPHPADDDFLESKQAFTEGQVRADALLGRSFRSFLKALGSLQCNIRRLSITNCKLGEEEIKYISQLLESPECKLTALNLSKNPLTEMGAFYLGKALVHKNCTLQMLSVAGCGGGSGGAELAVAGGGGGSSSAAASSSSKVTSTATCSNNIDEIVAKAMRVVLQNESCRLTSLDLSGISINSEWIKKLSEILQQGHCQLQVLNLLSETSHELVDEEAQRLLTEALKTNERVVAVNFFWATDGLRESATMSLHRNLHLKKAKLENQELMKSTRAKLFLCGHEQVGKTTLRKRIVHSSKIRALGSEYYYNWVHERARTQGMELETLTFGKARLTICDLAGQREYHAFHHFFMQTGSNKDLFLVVCKHGEHDNQDAMETQIKYWLRFIVSHRATANPKPKVIIVVNFFSPKSLTSTNLEEEAKNIAHGLVDVYKDVLDFGPEEKRNVFGVVALNPSHSTAIKNRLEVLLKELLDNRIPIFKVCKDVLRFTKKYSARRVRFLSYSQIFKDYKSYSKRHSGFTDVASEEIFLEVMLELHNIGHIVFFRLEDEALEKQLVILDPQWFCHKLIGSLLEPRRQLITLVPHLQQPQKSNPWTWREEDIKRILKGHGCKERYLDDVLKYLEKLQLLYFLGDAAPIDGETVIRPGKSMLFPALLSNSTIPAWPHDVNFGSNFSYFGRRWRCKNEAMTLLPSGVFARLQVHLHAKFGNRSYQVGDGWIAFREDDVFAVVKFGGHTGKWEDRHWIDVLVRNSGLQLQAQAEEIVCEIDDWIVQLCKGASERGYAEIVLEKCVLNESENEAVTFANLEKQVRKRGIQGRSHAWSFHQGSPLVTLFLSTELREFVTQHAYAIQDIQEEFGLTQDHAAEADLQEQLHAAGCPSHEIQADLPEPLAKLYAMLTQYISSTKREITEHMTRELKPIKEGISELVLELRNATAVLRSTCSSQLLNELKCSITELLDLHLPLLPYITDESGSKLQTNNANFQTGWLHLMCEFPKDCHPVKDQKGLKILLKAPTWLKTIIPVLIPAFKLICFAAKIDVNLFLPGPGAALINPCLGFLESFGIDQLEDLQEKIILSQALKKFVENDPIFCKRGLQQLQNASGLPKNASLDEFYRLLLTGKDVQMQKQFGLYRTQFGNDTFSWVCAKHSTHGRRLVNTPNPFSRYT